MSLPRFAVRRPVTTIMSYVAVALLGVIAWSRLPQELFPPITYPQVSIVTRYKDAAPEEIELLVTSPIEEVVGTVPRLRRLNSISKEEVSLVIAEFTWGTNMDFAALGVREKLDLVKERLPRGSEDPVVIKFNPFELPILVLNVSGPLPPYELLELARRQVKNVLEKIEGVASVNVTGGLEREILVEVDQGRLQASQTSLVALNEALAKANLNYPAGTIKEAFYEYLIRTIGEFGVVPEIQELAVNVEEDEQARRDRPERAQALQRQRDEPLRRQAGIYTSPRLVLLKDIAVVKDTYKERSSVARFNGQENVSLAVQKQAGANTVQVALRVHRAVEQIRLSLPPEAQLHVAYDQSAFIRQAIRGVADAAWQGALLAFLVLWWFLRNPWIALNVAAAIPLSILATFGLMYFSGLSLNIISLGGLALGIGLLVDAGVVVVENIARHRELGRSPDEAAIQGTEEVGMAILGTVLTTIVVFLPMIFVIGIVGQLFKELAFTVTCSNLASLFVSLTLTALFASWIRVRPRAAAAASGAGLRMGGLAATGQRVVRWFLDHRGVGIGLVVGSFVISLMAAGSLGQEFLPKVDQGQFIIKAELPPGTRLDVTDRVARRLEQLLIAHPAVQDVTVNIGSSKERSAGELIETLGPHQGQLLVGLRPRAKRRVSSDVVIQQLQASITPLALEGAQLEYVIQESPLKSAVLLSAPIVIEIRGEQLPILEGLARTVEHELARLPGLYGVRTSVIPPSPELKVRVLKDRAAAYHLSVSDIALTAQTAVKGFVATKFKEGGREIDVRVRLRPEDRQDLNRVRRLVVRSPLQAAIPLAEVAYIAVGRGPTEIRRQDRQRTILVSGNLFQRRFGDAMRDVTAMLQRLSVPPGYEVKMTGENEQMQESFKSLQFALWLSIILVYMIMASTFESLWQPFLIMATIPMSLIGIVAALWLTGTPVSVMVGLGFIILGGIVVDNGIVLIDYVNQLQREGRSAYDAVLEASQTRFRPILMTAATTILGLLPLALGWGEGVELQGPMAITVMGGLISSTFLTLVFLPTLYLIGAEWVARFAPRYAPAMAPTPALAIAAPEAPEIPEDYGREDAAPSEPMTAWPPVMPSIGPPEPPEEDRGTRQVTGDTPTAPTPEPPAAPPPPPLGALPLNARQRWLLDTLKTEGRMTRKDYAARTGVSIPTAARDLRELVEAGLLRGIGPLGPGRQYELIEKGVGGEGVGR